MSDLLVVEDEDALRRALARHLRAAGNNVTEASHLGAALREIDAHDFDVVLVDVNLPDGLGLGVPEQLAKRKRRSNVIVMTGQELVDHAVQAIRSGARDFLVKPFSMAALDAALLRLEETRQLSMRPSVSSGAMDTWRRLHVPRAFGNNKLLRHALGVVRRVAPTNCAVLIHGETGTGKELIARAIHDAGPRRGRPFVALNCAAVPESLMESELFGHARGAFTGATNAHKGRFALADGGTLFLDEIGEMPLMMQAKLLRVLQEGEIVPVGDESPRSVDVRVVAATHRDIEALAREGRFREDLLYRLDVIRVELPPLRDRRDDIPTLIDLFISEVVRERGAQVTGIDADAAAALVAYDWPGNVRQLRHAIERMVLLASGETLTIDDLPPAMRATRAPAAARGPILPPNGLDLRDAVEEFENGLILQALERTGWNKNQAAAILQMNRTTLVEKLKKKGLAGPSDE